MNNHEWIAAAVKVLRNINADDTTNFYIRRAMNNLYLANQSLDIWRDINE